METCKDFAVRLATKDDALQIDDHLKDYFYREEPINSSINLIDSIEMYNDLDDIQSVDDGVSFVAIDKYNQIIGVCLSRLRQRFEVVEDVKVNNPKLNMIFKLLDCVEAEADIFRKFPEVDVILSVNIISVSSKWRGRGVAQELLSETRKFAKQLGVHLIEVECTSYFSTRLMKKLGYKSIHAKKYADYVENGKPVFTPEHPHSEVNVMVLSL